MHYYTLFNVCVKNLPYSHKLGWSLIQSKYKFCICIMGTQYSAQNSYDTYTWSNMSFAAASVCTKITLISCSVGGAGEWPSHIFVRCGHFCYAIWPT